MKRVAWLTAISLCSAMLVLAADKSNAFNLTGTICNEKCVTQSAGKATCDSNCADTSGNLVCIDTHGKVHKIANPEMAKSMAGKKVNIKGTVDKDTGTLDIQNIVEYRGP